MSQPQEGKKAEKPDALRTEVDPEGQNPKGGTGMKQGRQTEAGARP